MASRTELRIIIVEDSEEVKRSLSLMLRAARYEVRCFESADELLRSGSELNGHILLVDYVMPGMDGLALVAELRASGWEGKAILITGFYDLSLPRRARTAGIDTILEKPLDRDVLLRAIEAAREAGLQMPLGR